MWNVNFQMFKLDFEKAEGPETNCQHHLDYQKSKRVPEKASTSALLTMPKPLTMWIKTNCGNFFKRWEYPTTLPASWEICMQAKKKQFEPYIERDWFKIRKGVHQGRILSPCLFNYYAEFIMRMMGWMNHKLESRLPEEISITSDMQIISPLWQKVKKN